MAYPERKRTPEQELNMACVSTAHAIAKGARSIREVVSNTGLCEVSAARAIRRLKERGELWVTSTRWFVKDEAWR